MESKEDMAEMPTQPDITPEAEIANKIAEQQEFARHVLETARLNDIRRKTPPPIPADAKRNRVARGTPPLGK